MKRFSKNSDSNHSLQTHADIQGTFLGMPYDFRRPTKARILSRIWNESAPLFPARAWGLGWTVNLKHAKAPLFLLVTALIGGVAFYAALSGK